ncbi:MAG: hypothetical protein ACR2H2_13370 [Solirubrobacteraceae bacterium]
MLINPTDASLQINLGVVQCTDQDHGMQAGRPWSLTASLIADTNHTIIERIADRTGF